MKCPYPFLLQPIVPLHYLSMLVCFSNLLKRLVKNWLVWYRLTSFSLHFVFFFCYSQMFLIHPSLSGVDMSSHIFYQCVTGVVCASALGLWRLVKDCLVYARRLMCSSTISIIFIYYFLAVSLSIKIWHVLEWHTLYCIPQHWSF